MKVPPPLVSDDPIAQADGQDLTSLGRSLNHRPLGTVLEGGVIRIPSILNRYKQCRGSSDINWKKQTMVE